MKKIIIPIIILFILSSCGQPEAEGTKQDSISEKDHRIFVTSSTTAAASIGGVVGGDKICADIAKEAGLTRTYLAILSDGDTTAFKRLLFTGEIYMIDSSDTAKLVAVSSTDFWDTENKNLLSAVNINEKGETISATPWTGSNGDGTGAFDHCSRWASSTGNGVVGSTDEVDFRWIGETMPTQTCSSSNALFCISQ